MKPTGRHIAIWGAALLIGGLVLPVTVLASGDGGISSAKIWDFVWRCLNFGVLFTALFIVLRKPIGKFFSGRVENIAQTLDDFETKKKEAEAAFRALDGQMANLAADRDRILAEYVKAGQEERDRIVAHAHEMATRIMKQAEVTIGQEVAAAKTELRKEIANQAAAMAEGIIQKHIDDADQERLVEEYLAKVVPN